MDRTYLQSGKRTSKSTLTIAIAVVIAAVVVVSFGAPVSASAPATDADERTQIQMDATAAAPALDGLGLETEFESPTPLQSEQHSHLAALIGIFALVLLGGTLVVRKRLGSHSETERTDRSTGSEEFMTDRERVRQLVNENGGRMKQAEIVDSVEWSKAKVSRLLADLESEDEITKLRLGRENLICLRGQEPQASKSPERVSSE